VDSPNKKEELFSVFDFFKKIDGPAQVRDDDGTTDQESYVKSFKKFLFAGS